MDDGHGDLRLSVEVFNLAVQLEQRVKSGVAMPMSCTLVGATLGEFRQIVDDMFRLARKARDLEAMLEMLTEDELQKVRRMVRALPRADNVVPFRRRGEAEAGGGE